MCSYKCPGTRRKTNPRPLMPKRTGKRERASERAADSEERAGSIHGEIEEARRMSADRVWRAGSFSFPSLLTGGGGRVLIALQASATSLTNRLTISKGMSPETFTIADVARASLQPSHAHRQLSFIYFRLYGKKLKIQTRSVRPSCRHSPFNDGNGTASTTAK